MYIKDDIKKYSKAQFLDFLLTFLTGMPEMPTLTLEKKRGTMLYHEGTVFKKWSLCQLILAHDNWLHVYDHAGDIDPKKSINLRVATVHWLLSPIEEAANRGEGRENNRPLGTQQRTLLDRQKVFPNTCMR